MSPTWSRPNGRSKLERSDDAALIQTTAELVHLARRLEPTYAGGKIPATTADFSRLLRRATCRVHLVNLPPGQSTVRAMATVPIGGFYRVGIPRDTPLEERLFAARHELGHVLAGEADEPILMADRDYLTFAERRADLFALADLVPGSLIAVWRRARFTWGNIADEVEEVVREQWGQSWPWARLDDRARLRVRLFREAGI